MCVCVCARARDCIVCIELSPTWTLVFNFSLSGLRFLSLLHSLSLDHLLSCRVSLSCAHVCFLPPTHPPTLAGIRAHQGKTPKKMLEEFVQKNKLKRAKFETLSLNPARCKVSVKYMYMYNGRSVLTELM